MGIVGVLNRQILQRRLLSLAEGAIKQAGLRQKYAQRPAVKYRMMGGQQSDVLIVVQSQNRETDQGPLLQIERPPRFQVCQSPSFGQTLICRQMRQVFDDQRKRLIR